MEKTKSKNGEFFLLFDKGGKIHPTRYNSEKSVKKQIEAMKDSPKVKTLCFEKFSSKDEAERYMLDLYEKNEVPLFLVVLPKKKGGRVTATLAYKQREEEILKNQEVYPKKFLFRTDVKRKAKEIQELENREKEEKKKRGVKKAEQNFQTSINKRDLDKEEFNKNIKKEIESLSKNEMIAFVDGSMAGDGKGSWAVILFSKNKKEIFGSSFSAETKYGNIESELMAARKAILLAKEREATSLKIYYDSHSIPQLAEKEESKGFFYEYFKEVQDGKSEMKIELAYSPAHCGILYNEQCDKISKFLLSE